MGRTKEWLEFLSKVLAENDGIEIASDAGSIYYEGDALNIPDGYELTDSGAIILPSGEEISLRSMSEAPEKVLRRKQIEDAIIMHETEKSHKVEFTETPERAVKSEEPKSIKLSSDKYETFKATIFNFSSIENAEKTLLVEDYEKQIGYFLDGNSFSDDKIKQDGYKKLLENYNNGIYTKEEFEKDFDKLIEPLASAAAEVTALDLKEIFLDKTLGGEIRSLGVNHEFLNFLRPLNWNISVKHKAKSLAKEKFIKHAKELVDINNLDSDKDLRMLLEDGVLNSELPDIIAAEMYELDKDAPDYELSLGGTSEEEVILSETVEPKDEGKIEVEKKEANEMSTEAIPTETASDTFEEPKEEKELDEKKLEEKQASEYIASILAASFEFSKDPTNIEKKDKLTYAAEEMIYNLYPEFEDKYYDGIEFIAADIAKDISIDSINNFSLLEARREEAIKRGFPAEELDSKYWVYYHLEGSEKNKMSEFRKLAELDPDYEKTNLEKWKKMSINARISNEISNELETRVNFNLDNESKMISASDLDAKIIALEEQISGSDKIISNFEGMREKSLNPELFDLRIKAEKVLLEQNIEKIIPLLEDRVQIKVSNKGDSKLNNSIISNQLRSDKFFVKEGRKRKDKDGRPMYIEGDGPIPVDAMNPAELSQLADKYLRRDLQELVVEEQELRLKTTRTKAEERRLKQLSSGLDNLSKLSNQKASLENTLNNKNQKEIAKLEKYELRNKQIKKMNRDVRFEELKDLKNDLEQRKNNILGKSINSTDIGNRFSTAQEYEDYLINDEVFDFLARETVQYIDLDENHKRKAVSIYEPNAEIVMEGLYKNQETDKIDFNNPVLSREDAIKIARNYMDSKYDISEEDMYFSKSAEKDPELFERTYRDYQALKNKSKILANEIHPKGGEGRTR